MTEHRDRELTNHQPGYIILDRCLPGATPEQREEARAQLMALVGWQLRIIVRQLREEADSREPHARDKLESAPPPP